MTWQWSTIKDAYNSADEISYVVDGIIPEYSLCLFYGTPGSLKTMLIMDMAMCIANNENWLPGRDLSAFEVKQVNILWIDMDNGQIRLNQRVKALAKGHRLPSTQSKFKYISFPDPPFVANETKSINLLIDEIKAFNAGFVVIDNLLSISGDIDENSPKMRGIMLGLRTVIEKAGPSMVVIHHTTKNEENYRGHSSIGQYSDLMIRTERDNNLVKLSATKERDYPVPQIGMLWEHEVTGKTLTWGKFSRCKPTYNQTIKTIMDFTAHNPESNQTSIIDAVQKDLPGTGRGKIRKNILYLVEEGSLAESVGSLKNSKLYSANGTVDISYEREIALMKKAGL